MQSNGCSVYQMALKSPKNQQVKIDCHTLNHVNFTSIIIIQQLQVYVIKTNIYFSKKLILIGFLKCDKLEPNSLDVVYFLHSLSELSDHCIH